MENIALETFQKTVGTLLKPHNSYDIDSEGTYGRTKLYFYNESESSEGSLLSSVRKAVDGDLLSRIIDDNSLLLTMPKSVFRKESIAIEVTRLRKAGYEDYVEVAINRAMGIDILNRIDTRTKRHVARLRIGEKPLLSFAVDLLTGRFIYKAKGRWYRWNTEIPFRFTGYVERLLWNNEDFRKLIAELLRLSSRNCLFLKDIAASIENHGCLGYDISFDELTEYHNANQFFRKAIGKDGIPLNYNKLSFFEGALVMRLLPHISQKEYAVFAQLVRNREVFGAFIQTLLTDKYYFMPGNLENGGDLYILKDFLMLYYMRKGILAANDEIMLYDLLRMRYELEADEVFLFRFRSRAGVKRTHDVLMCRKETLCTDPDRVIIRKDSKFNSLRQLLPNDFEWITTAGRIVRESNEQHNCVRTYTDKTLRDECAIYHWEKDDRKYTIEFGRDGLPGRGGKFSIRQMLQKYNMSPEPGDEEIVREYLKKAI